MNIKINLLKVLLKDIYNIDRLVYYELTDSVETALNREKQLKRWHRDWKINLIKERNPQFKDLSMDWT